MMPCTEALRTQLGLFTRVRGRGILRSSQARSSKKFAPDFGKCNHALLWCKAIIRFS
jgi:hypothetical protein